MLVELRVRHLGVIDDETLLLGPGMTALTGETGAGKTLVVGAIGLLVGARADPVLVRTGAAEAVVEGRFVPGAGRTAEPGSGRTTEPGAGLESGPGTPSEEQPADELVLRRVVPAEGRARAYLDGRMASSAALAETAAGLLDVHGQHAHQSLLQPAAQRRALDLAGGIDLAALRAARAELRGLRAELDALGGDARARAREADLLRFQADELDAARLVGADEEDVLREEEDRLADAAAHRDASSALHELLVGDGGLADRLGSVLGLLAGRVPLRALEAGARSVLAEVTELAEDARRAAEGIEEDPGRLAEVGDRRHQLADLRRKYGDTLTEVLAYRDEVARRLDRIQRHDERATALQERLAAAETAVADAEARVHRDRRAAAAPLAEAIAGRLADLALSGARFVIRVGDEAPGDDVEWLLAANPGEALQPLRQVASGGELARTMLAARLVLGDVDGPGAARTLVFDEVDAGIGGEAAVAVGAALAELGRTHQVLVVTHLAQVAAFADRHVVVTKAVQGDRTVAGVGPVSGEERVRELARMLSGRPDSGTARRHAEELLDQGGRAPGAGRPRAGGRGAGGRRRGAGAAVG